MSPQFVAFLLLTFFFTLPFITSRSLYNIRQSGLKSWYMTIRPFSLEEHHMVNKTSERPLYKVIQFFVAIFDK